MREPLRYPMASRYAPEPQNPPQSVCVAVDEDFDVTLALTLAGIYDAVAGKYGGHMMDNFITHHRTHRDGAKVAAGWRWTWQKGNGDDIQIYVSVEPCHV